MKWKYNSNTDQSSNMNIRWSNEYLNNRLRVWVRSHQDLEGEMWISPRPANYAEFVCFNTKTFSPFDLRNNSGLFDSFPGGRGFVCFLQRGSVYIWRECMPPLLGEGSASGGGVCLLARWGSASWPRGGGVCLLEEGCWADPYPCGQTDSYENITFPW